ncbi:MFS general substrate transporter, partial [Fistulina hepatica ATCC 64428]
GNQLNYITTAWTRGYVIGQIPSNLLITRISPSLWVPGWPLCLPMMYIVWSALTIALAGAKNFSTLVALCFFIGMSLDFLSEATFYPGMQYILGSWYKPTELGKRACLFNVASAIGSMFSGFLQTGAYDGLNGVKGLAGWQWLFIIDGIITIPVVILGFIMPNLPHNTKPSYIYTERELAMACKRMDEIGRRAVTGAFMKEKIQSFFTTWHIYTLVPIYVLYNNGLNPSSSMIYWFKSFNTSEKMVYSVSQINTYPLREYAVQVITTLVWAWWSDAMQMHWPPMIVAAIWNTAVCIALAATPVYAHIAGRRALYYM